MSILDMFRGAAPNNTPAQAQQQQVPAPTQPAGAQQQSQVQDAQNALSTPAAGTSPLDNYKDLWQPATNEAGGATPIFNVDSAKILEAAGKANFASGLSPEVVANALKGDANAFMQAINSVAQQSFAQATIAATKLMEQGLEKHGQQQQELLPSLVKKSLVSNSMQDNPLYKHEATRPLLSALESQLAAKYPNATASQITEHAQQFISEFAKVASGTDAQSQQQQGARLPDPNDWSNF